MLYGIHHLMCINLSIYLTKETYNATLVSDLQILDTLHGSLACPTSLQDRRG